MKALLEPDSTIFQKLPLQSIAGLHSYLSAGKIRKRNLVLGSASLEDSP